MDIVEEQYRGWSIVVKAEDNMCARFSFEVTSPTGNRQHVSMGGENEHRAMERAKELIDMEIAFAEEA